MLNRAARRAEKFGRDCMDVIDHATGKVIGQVAAVTTAGAGLVQAAHAAVDTTAVGTAITAAQTSGEGVGTMVIGAIAGLAVIGVIITVVRKL